jgi:hypothetical protein
MEKDEDRKGGYMLCLLQRGKGISGITNPKGYG